MKPKPRNSKTEPSSAEDPLSEEDLWFLPGPMDEERDFLTTGPVADSGDKTILDDWKRAEAGQAAGLARVAGLVGALDERLRRGPEGWRHRLALIEAADLSWFIGDRVSPDRIALWMSMRLAGVQQDSSALTRVGWAVRRLTGGPGPEAGLADFLDRRDRDAPGDAQGRFSERAGEWHAMVEGSAEMHPISRACVCFHLWGIVGLDQDGEQMEAAVTAGRIAASEGRRDDLCAAGDGRGRGAAQRGRPGGQVHALAGRDAECHADGDAAPGRGRGLGRARG